MRRAAAALCLALAGCGGGGSPPSHPPRVTTVDTRLELGGQVAVQQIRLGGAGESRVPALFSVPRGVAPRGCLIWQNGLAARTGATAQLWDGAARLGLAVLSVDLTGAGAAVGGDGPPPDLAAALADPPTLATLVRASVSDLGRAIAYLEQRPECRRNIGFGGTGVGAMLGALLAGRDPRVRAVVLGTAAPTWASLVTAGRQAGATALAPLDPVRWAPRIAPRPVLVLVDRDDPHVPATAAAQMAAAVGQPRRIVVYRGRSAPQDGRDAIAAFLLRWLVRPTYAS